MLFCLQKCQAHLRWLRQNGRTMWTLNALIKIVNHLRRLCNQSANQSIDHLVSPGAVYSCHLTDLVTRGARLMAMMIMMMVAMTMMVAMMMMMMMMVAMMMMMMMMVAMMMMMMVMMMVLVVAMVEVASSTTIMMMIKAHIVAHRISEQINYFRSLGVILTF